MQNSYLKRFTLVAISTILVSLMSACGGSSSDDTINFWAYQPSKQADQNAFKTLVSNFTNETGIKVKLSLVAKDSFNTSLVSALGSRSKPDISFLDQPLIADYASKSTIADLTSYISDISDFNDDRFFDYVHDTCVYKDKTYGIPLNMTASVLFYNKTLVSTAPSTWSDVIGVWDSLASGVSLFDSIGNAGYAGWYFQSFLSNFGGSLVNEAKTSVSFNDEFGQEAAQMIKELYQLDNAQAVLNRASSNAFGRGLIAFKLGSSSDIDAYDTNFPKLDYGVCLMPTKSSGQTSYSNMGGENLVVFEQSNKKESCIQLAKYLLKKENITQISSFTGNFPSIKEYATQDNITYIKEASKERKTVILTQMNTAVPRPVIPNWLEVNDLYLGPAISDKILSVENPIDIKTALDDAAIAANSRLFSV